MRRLALALLLPLAACATPRQQCERAATEDLQVVSALIVEIEQNLARGYAIDREVRERPHVQFCYGNHRDDDHVGIVFCNTTETYVVEKPVAIDVAAEQAKLTALQAKRTELKQQALQALAICDAKYPEG
ncbi:hypothetical protein [Actibacterium sp. D379-3]